MNVAGARCFVPWNKMDAKEVSFILGSDRTNKPMIRMVVGPNAQDVAMITPPCATNWPRCTGDGNYGTMWGPSDITKAKFSLDLTDGQINATDNPYFLEFATVLEIIDDKLLEFVFQNQLKILGRKHLSREEVKMLQIRTVRPKYDKLSGSLVGHTVQLSTQKYVYDGMGGKFARNVNVCNATGHVITDGNVCPGDIVSATMYANQVYTGVGGDKFGVHWGFSDVSVICQRMKQDFKTHICEFSNQSYDFAQDYSMPVFSNNNDMACG